MFAFLAIPLVRKIAIYGAVVLGALWLLRMWSNKAYNAGYDKGKVAGVEATMKAHEQEWAAAQKELDNQKALLAGQSTQLATDKALAVSNRKTIQETLQTGLEKNREALMALNPAIVALPEPEVNKFIRRSLEELRK
jgi:hypothetical protein